MRPDTPGIARSSAEALLGSPRLAIAAWRENFKSKRFRSSCWSPPSAGFAAAPLASDGSSAPAAIRSLAYFQPVIARLQQQPLPNGYLDYLRFKMRKVV